jgi:hypothetical protein
MQITATNKETTSRTTTTTNDNKKRQQKTTTKSSGKNLTKTNQNEVCSFLSAYSAPSASSAVAVGPASELTS